MASYNTNGRCRPIQGSRIRAITEQTVLHEQPRENNPDVLQLAMYLGSASAAALIPRFVWCAGVLPCLSLTPGPPEASRRRSAALQESS